MIIGVIKQMDNLKNYFKGWIVGNFEPNLFKTNDIEIAIKRYKKGDKEEKHYHKIAKEFTIVIDGKILMNGNQVKKNQIFIVEPEVSNVFEALTNATLLVIKTPSVVGDKYTE